MCYKAVMAVIMGYEAVMAVIMGYEAEMASDGRFTGLMISLRITHCPSLGVSWPMQQALSRPMQVSQLLVEPNSFSGYGYFC